MNAVEGAVKKKRRESGMLKKVRQELADEAAAAAAAKATAQELRGADAAKIGHTSTDKSASSTKLSASIGEKKKKKQVVAAVHHNGKGDSVAALPQQRSKTQGKKKPTKARDEFAS